MGLSSGAILPPAPRSWGSTPLPPWQPLGGEDILTSPSYHNTASTMGLTLMRLRANDRKTRLGSVLMWTRTSGTITINVQCTAATPTPNVEAPNSQHDSVALPREDRRVKNIPPPHQGGQRGTIWCGQKAPILGTKYFGLTCCWYTSWWHWHNARASAFISTRAPRARGRNTRIVIKALVGKVVNRGKRGRWTQLQEAGEGCSRTEKAHHEVTTSYHIIEGGEVSHREKPYIMKRTR